MKDVFKKTFDNKVVKPITVGLAVFLIFTFIVFPGLTTADTVINIITSLIGIFTLVFLFYYIDGGIIEDPIIEPGETELDYINPEELKPKKKRNNKQFPEIKSDGTFVKTRKKKVNKSEFPLPPHHSNKKK
jgi:hypothetical protein